ncbi:MAG: hypothetical protein ILO53_03110 [Clostridia bacterium]|nr:hypothetical protein [Clostridia bacterium]
MDANVIEVFIKARKNRLLPLYYALILAAALVLSGVVYYLYRLIGFFLVVIICAIAFYLILILRKFNDLEYEVSIVSGEMTVSEIRNQTRRRQLAKFHVKDIQSFKIIGKEDLPAGKGGGQKSEHTKLLCCVGDYSADDSPEIYSFSVRNAENGITYQVYMDVDDERVIDEMVSKCFEVRRALKRI